MYTVKKKTSATPRPSLDSHAKPCKGHSFQLTCTVSDPAPQSQRSAYCRRPSIATHPESSYYYYYYNTSAAIGGLTLFLLGYIVAV